ncbi:hypothetical protein PInf_004529 [Phytophthora infestans]|nr:hypothetical protein PInf_004529 [Phytophthora infestans]
MVSSGNLFNNFVSHPGVPFLCRIVGKPSGFDIEIFDTTHEKAWACRVTSEVLVLDNDTSTTLPWEKAKAFLEVGLMSRGAAEDVALDFVEQLEEVYKSGAEISSVYDYTCGLFSIGISSAYVHTIPVDANDTISVKYVGGGTLFTWDSFMDVLLLPTTTH